MWALGGFTYEPSGWWNWWQKTRKQDFAFLYDWEFTTLMEIDPSLVPDVVVIPQVGYGHPERGGMAL